MMNRKINFNIKLLRTLKKKKKKFLSFKISIMIIKEEKSMDNMTINLNLYFFHYFD